MWIVTVYSCTHAWAHACLQVRMRFDIETADYLHLMKPEASFPPFHFSMLADTAKYEVRVHT